MMYPYECKNKDCKDCKVEVTVSKPMMESSREEKCEKCDSIMERIFKPFAMRSADGFKGS